MKECFLVFNTPLKDQKPTILFFGKDGTNYFVKKTIRHYKKEQPSGFLKKFLRQSQSATPERVTKEAKNLPITPNRQGTVEMRDEVLSSVDAQNMDTSGFQVSGLEDIEFDWEQPDLIIHTIFQPGIDAAISLQLATFLV